MTKRPDPAVAAVGDIMTRTPATLAVDAKVSDARSTLLDQGVSALPIVDSQDRPVGIVTKTDLVSAVEDDVPVAVLMTSRLLTCSPESSVSTAAATMRSNRVHHLLVVEGGTLAGMLSVFDLLQFLESGSG